MLTIDSLIAVVSVPPGGRETAVIGPVEVSRDGRTLRWNQPHQVRLAFRFPIRSWIRSPDGNSLLVAQEAAPLEENLFRIADDGTTVWRSGSRDPRHVTIDQLLAEGDDVIAIEITTGGDYRCKIDLETGEFSRISPWR